MKSRICEKYGFASKLTGAGKGGYCICFMRKNVEDSIKKVFFEVHIVH